MREEVFAERYQFDQRCLEMMAFIHQHIPDPSQPWRHALGDSLFIGWDPEKGLAYISWYARGHMRFLWENTTLPLPRPRTREARAKLIKPEQMMRLIEQWDEVVHALLGDNELADSLYFCRMRPELERRLQLLGDLLKPLPWSWSYTMDGREVLRYSHRSSVLYPSVPPKFPIPHSRAQVAEWGRWMRRLLRQWPQIVASAQAEVNRALLLRDFRPEVPDLCYDYLADDLRGQMEARLEELNALLDGVSDRFVYGDVKHDGQKYSLRGFPIPTPEEWVSTVRKLLDEWPSVMEAAHAWSEEAQRQPWLHQSKARRERALEVLRRAAELQRSLPHRHIHYDPASHRAYISGQWRIVPYRLWSDGTASTQYGIRDAIRYLAHHSDEILNELNENN